MTLCTTYSAFWCPRCGDCTCERAHDGHCCFDDTACPLHGQGSKHSETVELGQAEELVRDMATRTGVTLTDDDHETVSRFAQFLSERHRAGVRPSLEALELRKKLGIE